MRYFVTLRGVTEAEPVDVEPLPEGRLSVSFRGRRHEVDARALAHQAVSLLLDGASHSVELEEDGDEMQVLAHEQVVRLTILDERRYRLLGARGGFTVSGRQEIRAPMPGKVVRVLVKTGQEVTEGQGLVVVEAMKMENELRAPKAGKVTELLAQEGATVEMNARLVVVE